MRASAIEPSEAAGEAAEGAPIQSFEDAARAVLEDDDALDEDEESGELADEDEPVQVGRVVDPAGVPVEGGGLVIAEALRRVHPMAVLGAADPGRAEVGDEPPGRLVTPSPAGDDAEVAPAGT